MTENAELEARVVMLEKYLHSLNAEIGELVEISRGYRLEIRALKQECADLRAQLAMRDAYIAKVVSDPASERDASVLKAIRGSV